MILSSVLLTTLKSTHEFHVAPRTTTGIGLVWTVPFTMVVTTLVPSVSVLVSGLGPTHRSTSPAVGELLFPVGTSPNVSTFTSPAP